MFFPNYLWFLWNSTFDSWFGLFCNFHVGSDDIFVVVIRSMSFQYLLMYIEFVSHSHCIFITNISIGKWGPLETWILTVSYFCENSGVYLQRWFCDWKIFLQKGSMLYCSARYISFSCLWLCSSCTFALFGLV